MKYILCGAGTMGHVTPALAIRELLLKDDSNAEFLYVSRKDGPENRLISRASIPLDEIEIRGLDRGRPLRNLTLPLIIARAVERCKEIIQAKCVGAYLM